MSRWRGVSLVVLVTVMHLPALVLGQGIQTVAGRSVGDGGPAIDAVLYAPYGVSVDGEGNVYITDYTNNRIRRVDGATGIITTVAGDGTAGFAGDGGPGTEARLSQPCGVSVDGAGNVYIADSGNHRIRRVDGATGIITTVAGNGTAGFSGDGGPAIDARLYAPCGVLVAGPGNLLIADKSNHRIRRVDGATGIITTVAGNGTAGFSGDDGPAIGASLSAPFRVSADGADNLYIADPGNHRVRRVDGATGIITTVAGNGSAGSSGNGGPATDASLDEPYGVSVDGSGNLYIADKGTHNVRRVDWETGIITTVAGGGGAGIVDGLPATQVCLHWPRGVTVDGSGNYYIADEHLHRILRVDGATGIITRLAGDGTAGFSGDGGPAIGASLCYPRSLSVDGSENLYIADTNNHRIRRVDGATGTITTMAGNGIYGFSGDGGPAIDARLSYPQGVCVDGSGNLYIAHANSHRIRRVDGATGIISTVAGNGTTGLSGDGGPATEASLWNPHGVSVDASGNLYIADKSNSCIRRVDGATGIITTVAGIGTVGFSGDGGPATEARLNSPYGVLVDGPGNLLIADRSNHRIRRVDGATGIITTVAGNGTAGFSGDGGPATEASLWYPNKVSVDVSGSIYVADSGNHRIRRVDGATGIITTVAGDGTAGFAGDGGPAADARLAWPSGVSVGGSGDLYIADSKNDRIRVVDAIPTFVVPLSEGWNLISLGEPSANESIATLMAPIVENLTKVVGFETDAINPNPPETGGKLYNPLLAPFINTLKLTDFHLAYWIEMNTADVLVTGGLPAKVISSPVATESGGLHPVYDFMGIHGELRVDGEPAPVGTMVEVVDGEGTLAGRSEVHHEGYYGYLPVYRDDVGTPVDEGADTGEWLGIRVNGQLASQRVQWTAFGDVVQLDLEATSQPSSSLPTVFALGHNYPNPFNPSTTIHYQLPRDEEVVLSIWNLAGQLVRELVHTYQTAGSYWVAWDGRDEAGSLLGNGVYLYEIRAGGFRTTRKMVLMK